MTNPTRPAPLLHKADVFGRLIAKLIDLLIAMVLSYILWPLGFVVGIAYVLLADGFFHGQSLGKRMMGLKVMIDLYESNKREGLWRDSVTRNLPIAISLFFATAMNFQGFLGFILGILGALIIVFETYFVVTDDRGIRLGDIFAHSQVTSEKS